MKRTPPAGPVEDVPSPTATIRPDSASTPVRRIPPDLPAGAVIVIADEKGYADAAMKGEPLTWCWLGGPTWFYVKDYPIPHFSRKR